MTTTRRTFIRQAAVIAASSGGAASLHATAATDRGLEQVPSIRHQAMSNSSNEFQFPQNYGLGGVGPGNGWHTNTSEQINQTLQAAWDAGVRYYDTSPFYGYGLSERRFGHFLFEKERSEYLLSTKIGRIFEADPKFEPGSAGLWKGQLNFKFRYDYTADGVKRSLEDSLQRLGLSSIDIVFVHDLSPDNGDFGERWTEQFDIATKGAFPALTKLREEGVIKAWGLGVNRPQPILKALEVADPDVMLVAIQYTLFEHEDALTNLFPAMAAKNVKAVIGGPLNGGFAADLDRWNYGPGLPQEMVDKRNRIKAIADKYNISLSTVALQFAAQHPVVAAVIPGASRPEQVQENVQSFHTNVPAGLWKALKEERLIHPDSPVGT
ncbi:aldo/keto reductase [Parapedobacter koreensis]|uniref:D-threo-aldose 1-dehydrogenase n=1 Tax=Parapedobacter koreensis TaxID=332977 RepID=A0A1H7LJK3_9SPHI|nr:aldo/keto reductase [Parapedobacter koreensis]SEK99153.1 D-threo-aldose 1-dehydrogenase [Parapedobacter koreensis]